MSEELFVISLNEKYDFKNFHHEVPVVYADIFVLKVCAVDDRQIAEYIEL